MYARSSTAEWLAFNQFDGGSNPPGRTKSSGSNSVWPECSLWKRGAVGSNPTSLTNYVPGVLGQQGLQNPSSRVRFLVPVPVASSVVQWQRQRA